MSWFFLIIAGLLEIVWAYTMKLSDGFSQPRPTLITVVAMVLSFWLLSNAMRSIPLGTAYMVWTGIGAIGAFVVGIVVLGDAVNPARLIAAGLIAAGLILLNVASHS